MVVFGVNFFIAQMYGHVEMMVVAAVMCGALLAFLRYNYHPASIFLGDTGSMFLGFMVAVTSLVSSVKASTAAMLIIPVGLLGYPLLDVTLAVLRRGLKGKPIFSSDRSHIHHKLLFCGLGHRASSAVGYGFTVLFAAMVVLSISGRHRIVGVLIGVAVCAVMVMFWQFGYWEFIRRTFSPGLRRRYRLYHLLQQVTELKLRRTEDLGEVWDLLRALGEDYELADLRLRVGGEEERSWCNPEAPAAEGTEPREFRLRTADAVLEVRHEEGKDRDIKLEQNLLLEHISKRLSLEIERIRVNRALSEDSLDRDVRMAEAEAPEGARSPGI